MPALYLSKVVVVDQFRGRGVGPAILRCCAAEAARHGCQAVRLDCHTDNPGL